MTYKLFDQTLEKISGHVICVLDGVESEYEDIHDLTSKVFDKKYVVSNICSRGDKTVISLQEDNTVPNDLSTDWHINI